MDSKERSSQRHWRVEDILGHLNDNVDKNNAELYTKDRIYVEQIL
jgi:hypothetical protein